MAKLIKIDRNGTKYYSELVTCDRCEGRGEYWWGAMINGRPQYAGVCFKCNGEGKVWGTRKEYTPEHAAKLEAERMARQAEAERRAAEEQARREAERKAAEEAAAIEAARIAAEKARSQYVGQVGERIEIKAEYIGSAHFEVRSFYGYGTDTMYIHQFKDAAGNKLIWKTSGMIDNNVIEKGTIVTVKGTIKEHSEYKDEKQTALTRCKVTA